MASSWINYLSDDSDFFKSLSPEIRSFLDEDPPNTSGEKASGSGSMSGPDWTSFFLGIGKENATAFNEGVNAKASGQGSAVQSTSSTSTGVGALMDMIFGLSNISKSRAEHEKYAKQIEKQNLDMPSGIRQAEQGLAKLSTGLPGYEILRQRIMNLNPTLLTQFEQLGSTNQVLDQLAKSGTRASYAMDSLNIENQNVAMKNQLALLSFLSGTKAPMQMKINEFNISKNLAAAQERMLGMKEETQNAQNIFSDAGSLIGLMAGGI